MNIRKNLTILVALLATFSVVQVNNSAKLTTLKVEIDINSPCHQLKEFAEGGHTSWARSLSYEVSFVRHVLEYCQHLYEYAIEQELSKMDRCIPSRIKRQIMDAIVAGTRLAVGVTNFITSATSNDPGKTLVDIGRDVVESTRRLLSSGDRNQLQLRDVSSISETSSRHKTELIELNGQLRSRMLFAAHHVHREIIAGMANLRAITNQCEQGRVATGEVAELLDDWTIADIKPENTIIRRVDIDRRWHIITIHFDQVEEEMKLGTSIIFICLGFALGGWITIVLYLCLKRRTSVQRQPISKENRESGNDLEMQKRACQAGASSNDNQDEDLNKPKFFLP